MIEVALLTTALLFGGMVLYSFGFAAFVFNNLPVETAGPLIRKAFPHFYAFVLITAALIAIMVAFLGDYLSLSLFVVILITTIFARQILMPATNWATDSAKPLQFKVLHGVSVAITLFHIAVAGYVIVRLSSA